MSSKLFFYCCSGRETVLGRPDVVYVKVNGHWLLVDHLQQNCDTI